jgi:D-threo-aldose 1-dehydrogenase
MRRLTLGATGIETSQVGFGCVRLTAQRNRREALRILEHAFDLGITHFDVARAYGFGRAEGILGEFLQGKRERVTVATKFGLQPPGGLAGNRWIIDTAKMVLGPFPKLLRRAKSSGAAMGKAGVFNPEAAIQSLETSLRELKTDYVDVLLLHEATLADATSEPLIEALQRQVNQGRVRCLGVASEFGKLHEDAALLPATYQVVQFNDNALARNLPRLAHRKPRALITHSVFQPADLLQEAIGARPQLVGKFSSEMNVELGDPRVTGSLLLQYALRSNADGIVLFSSVDPARVTANVHEAESHRWDEAQLSRFVKFVDQVLNPQLGSGLPDAADTSLGREAS